MAIIIGDEIPARPGRAGLVVMMQEVADFFAETIAKQPEDWHMMQPFFSEPEPPAEEAK
jgi:KDO2-lipid IV(A) lauroyltransferase